MHVDTILTLSLLCVLSLILMGCKSGGNVPEPQADAAKTEALVDTPKTESQPETSESASEAAPAVAGTMMIPSDALHSPSGYIYIRVAPGTGVKPSPKSAVDIHVRSLDLEGKLMDEADGTVAIGNSTPFFDEMLSLMEIGETLRIWGTSETSVMELQLVKENLEYRAPEDVSAPPADAKLLTGYEDVYWRVIEPGTGNPIKDGAALRIFGSRWTTAGEIIESNRAGRGLLVFMNEEQLKVDPVHHALFLNMAPGSHTRLWMPAKYEATGKDVVEDFWLAERLDFLETPADCSAPADTAAAIKIDESVWMRFEGTRAENRLKDGDAVEVDMTCWNRDSGQLVDASYLRENHDIMDIGPDLGIWEKIMLEAGKGDAFIVWIDQSKLPESVQMSLTCRVKVF